MAEKNMMNWEQICQTSQLGKLTDAPQELTGGLLHRMYAVETTEGKYAIKLLNPNIMERPEAMQNYTHSERVADFLRDKVPALPARQLDGDAIQKVQGQSYLVFDWVEGKSLKPNEITMIHCEKIGEILAGIHNADTSSLGIPKEDCESRQTIDWEFYLEKGREKGAEWVELLQEHLNHLKEWDFKANEAAGLLSKEMVISHRDLDAKNVLWKRGEPLLIDWESAGHINPMQDLMETAIYWSGNEHGDLVKEKFFSFLRGYKRIFGEVHADWKAVMAVGFSGKLAWLQYNLKRSLWIECTDEAEQQLGMVQVTETMDELNRYSNTIPELIDWLNDR